MIPKIILLADDDPDDLELLEEAFMNLETSVIINKVTSGKEALKYLHNCNAENLPCLVILDYNMPDLTGPEILGKFYKDPKSKCVPVIIWSTSNAPIYKDLSLKEGAIKYFEKPSSFADIQKLAIDMLTFSN